MNILTAKRLKILASAALFCLVGLSSLTYGYDKKNPENEYEKKIPQSKREAHGVGHG